jgi:hypothetical protein
MLMDTCSSRSTQGFSQLPVPRNLRCAVTVAEAFFEKYQVIYRSDIYIDGDGKPVLKGTSRMLDRKLYASEAASE